MTNTLYLLTLRRFSGTWVFSDPNTGLVNEPFVSGVPELINNYVPQNVNSFDLTVGESPFPSYTTLLQRQEEQYGGWWYVDTTTELRGWLCPALYKYYSTPPLKLYVKLSHFLYTT